MAVSEGLHGPILSSACACTKTELHTFLVNGDDRIVAWREASAATKKVHWFRKLLGNIWIEN
jgi:hypothetical protein